MRVFLAPLRVTLTSTESPGLCSSTSEESAVESSTDLPPSEVMTSPACRPAFAAGPPLVSCGDLGAGARGVLGLDAEVGVADLAGRAQLGDDALDRVGRDREADADVAGLAAGAARAGGLDLRVDADHLAGGVEQRAAGVAGVDRGVGLDDVVDREAVGRGDLALQRADDADRERAVEAERVADRVRRVADLDAARVAERERLEVVAETFRSARSVEASSPTSLASSVLPSPILALIWPLAPSTTWALVTM